LRQRLNAFIAHPIKEPRFQGGEVIALELGVFKLKIVSAFNSGGRSLPILNDEVGVRLFGIVDAVVNESRDFALWIARLVLKERVRLFRVAGLGVLCVHEAKVAASLIESTSFSRVLKDFLGAGNQRFTEQGGGESE
jgi:hypothetical protein